MEISQQSADLTNKHFFNFLLRIFMEIISIINSQTRPSDYPGYCNEVSIAHWEKLQANSWLFPFATKIVRHSF